MAEQREPKTGRKATTSKTPKAEQGTAQSSDKSKGGRPTDYTAELGDAICAEIANGTSLKRICERKEMPSRQTVYSWFRLYPEFIDNYTRAKDDSADALADDIEDIAHGVLTRKYDAQAARVAIDGKKWIASKLKPKKYGDKIDMTSGGDKLSLGLSPEQAEQLLRLRAKRDAADT